MRKIVLAFAAIGALLATAVLAEDVPLRRMSGMTPPAAVVPAPISQAVPAITRMPVFTPRVAVDRAWRGLTGKQILALNRILKKIEPTKINFFCGGTYCQKLAEDLDESFQSAGFDSYLQLPMFDIGVGFGISPDNETTRAIAAAMEKVTRGRVKPTIFPSGKVLDPASAAISVAIGRVGRPDK